MHYQHAVYKSGYLITCDENGRVWADCRAYRLDYDAAMCKAIELNVTVIEGLQ